MLPAPISTLEILTLMVRRAVLVSQFGMIQFPNSTSVISVHRLEGDLGVTSGGVAPCAAVTLW